ncbi:MAG: sugar phosphate isomerase/epimerase [Candidatus Sumerlaeota bacterium]|nr:sugar phosphate isomerase/epimerase [Candidatus Sumerlaeota bacterium]
MRVGVHSFSYSKALAPSKDKQKPPAMTMRGFMERVEQIGGEGFMFFAGDVKPPDLWGPEFIAMMREWTAQRGLYIELAVNTPENLARDAELAVQLGCTNMRGIVLRWLNGDRRNYKGNLEEGVDQAVRLLRQAAPRLEELGVRLGLENHLDLTMDEMLRVVERVGSRSVGLCLDTGNALGSLEDPVETARKAAPHVFSTHFKDWKAGWTRRGFQFAGCPMGQGVVDLKEIVRLLARHQPDLTLSVESCPFQRFEVPFFEDDWWAGFPQLHAKHMARFTRFLRDRVTENAGDWRTPVEEGWPQERLLAHEDQMAREAVAYVRSELLPLTRLS